MVGAFKFAPQNQKHEWIIMGWWLICSSVLLSFLKETHQTPEEIFGMLKEPLAFLGFLRFSELISHDFPKVSCVLLAALRFSWVFEYKKTKA